MSQETTISSCGLEDSVIVTLLRLKNITTGLDLLQADINAGGGIVFSVNRKSDGLEIIAETIIPTTAVSDVILNDPRWGIIDNDETTQGFNFEHLVPQTAFPEGNETYEIRYTWTDNALNKWNFRVDHTTQPLIGS